jgi:DNA polymerase eta
MSSPSSRELGGRAVALIDMDAFYVGCERHLDPSLVGVPLAVVQYNPFQGDGNPGSSGVVSLPPQPSSARVAVRDGKVLMPSASNGSIIAVSYEARARGVTRFFRGREAVNTCPELVLIQVPTSHGKSDMGVYRDYGARALKLIQTTCGAGAIMEKASVDEMYIDLSKPAHAALSAASDYSELLREAEAAGTHVAGAAEGAEEAAMGAQPTGVLARSSFRAGHAGQVLNPGHTCILPLPPRPRFSCTLATCLAAPTPPRIGGPPDWGHLGRVVGADAP